jgi:hypothetical protein
MAYTDQEIELTRIANNISSDAIVVRTTSGGFVFINPSRTDVVELYESGQLDGTTSAPSGVILQVLPKEITETVTLTTTPTVTPTITSTDTINGIFEVQPPTLQTFIVSIIVTISPAAVPVKFTNSIIVNIIPEATPSQTLPFSYPINITTLPIEINLSTPIIFLARQFIESILNFYIDEDRELKTLVNYGEDRQSVALAWRQGETERSIQLKLLQPVPDTVELNTTTFLSREVAKSVIDTLRVRFAPPINETPYLRPKNTNISVNKLTGNSLRNKTLETLRLRSGLSGDTDSVNNISFEDQVFRQWYSYDFNSSELNIDFTQYDNFVFYSSAYLRLQAFRQKLRQIEQLDARRIQFISGSVFTGSVAFAGATYIQEQGALLSKQKEDIIRGFDRYEQYLYFTPTGSTSAYSASFDYVDGGVEYNPIGYWPKSGSVLWPVESIPATEWFTTQSAIAQRFDEFNENNLINTIPTHIREHDDNASYITFVLMIGHFFDTIKPYIDQFTNIYSRYADPNEELSKDLVGNVIESFGFTLPAINSLNSLADTVLSSQTTVARRNYTVETYKRLLHNLPLFSKAKGTRVALDALLRSLGFGPSVISVKETGTPTTETYVERDEYSVGLQFDKNLIQYITLPFATSERNPQTLQLTTRMRNPTSATILSGDDTWALYVTTRPDDTSYGRFELISSSLEVLATSSYQQIFDDTDVTLALLRDKLHVIKTIGSDLIFNESFPLNSVFDDTWSETNYVYVGGSGSLRTSGYDGVIDGVRLWNATLTDETILANAYDPNTTVGNTFKSPAENLLVKLAFDTTNEVQLISESVLENETPYFGRFDTPSLQSVEAIGFTTSSIVRYDRTIRQHASRIGATGIITNKVRVISPPVFNRWSRTKEDVPKLSRTKSIVLPDEKRKTAGKNRVLLSLSPVDAVNNNINRTIGNENVNNFVGLPPKLRNVFGQTLRELQLYYRIFYRNRVNYNTFTRTVGNLATVLNQVSDYFRPAKTDLLNGVVIESSILDRTRIPLEKNLRLYGKDTKKTLGAAASLRTRSSDYGATFNVEQDIQLILPDTVEGNTATVTTKLDGIYSQFILATSNLVEGELDTPLGTITGVSNVLTSTVEEEERTLVAEQHTYTSAIERDEIAPIADTLTHTTRVDTLEPRDIQSTINTILSDTIIDERPHSDIVSNYIVYNYQHESYETYDPDASGSRQLTRIDLGLRTLNKVGFNSTNHGSPGAEPYNRVYTRKLFDYEIDFPRIGGPTSLNPTPLYEIKPSTDFSDIGVTTFFNNDIGIYTFPETDLLPNYTSPIDISTATTWSYGNRYTIGDIVFQNVTPNDFDVLGTLINTSRGGNGRYYVFKTQPSYTPPTDGTQYFTGDIPSYTPPSLDQVNWDVLRFTPIERRVPRRVVFDTFIVKLPILNNFKITTIDFRKTLDIPARYVDTFAIPGTLATNQRVTGDFVVQNMLSLFALQANTEKLRVRLYRTAESRDADILRSSTTFPTGSHGVLLDVIINDTNAVMTTNPIPTLVAGSVPPNGRIFYTIDNLDTATKSSISVILYYYALQIEPRVPRNYLRKHYRYFRTNATGIKRHSYLGCKNTTTTTVDGLPPVQVFIGEGNTLKVAPTRLVDEIITGGGGTLDVT